MFGFNELSTPVKAIIALALVLLLVVIAGLILRRVAGGRLKLPGQGNRARQPRLGIVDIFEMDRQRQLVLLRRDNVEHLVMIGGPNDLVIEASILRSGTRVQLPVAPDGLESLPLPEPVPVVPPQPPRRAPQVGADQAPASMPPVPVPVPVPVPAPIPVPVSDQAASSPPLKAATMAGAAVAGTMAVGAAASLAALARTASAAPETSPQPPAPKAPDQSLVQAAPAIEPRFPMSPPAVSVTPLKPIIEPISSPPTAKASANELDDMTRQLEEALKRPFSGIKAPAIVPPVLVETGATVPAPGSSPSSEPATLSPQDTQVEDKAAEALGAKTVGAEPRPAEPIDLPEITSEVTGSDLPDATDALEPDAPEPDAFEPDALEPDVAPPDVAPPNVSELANEDTDESLPLDFERELAAALSLDLPEMALSKIEQPKAGSATKTAATTDPLTPQPVGPLPAEAASAVTLAPAVKPDSPQPEKQAVTQPAAARAAQMPDQPATAGKTATKPSSDVDASGLDPFSVDAIEAEFARLLNRNTPPKT